MITRGDLGKRLETAYTALDGRDAEIVRLRTALVWARDKLRHYRDAHGGEYVGGVEYSNLMREIDEALK